jgi:N-acetylglutamate synthase-like GNAT family acetyltransferase
LCSGRCVGQQPAEALEGFGIAVLLAMNVAAAAVIRPARSADLAAVCSLLIEAKLPTEDLPTAPGLCSWVLENDGAPVGHIALECAGAGGVLRSLVVRQPYRGRGWGKALVQTLEQAAHSADITQLVLLTETAQVFFASLDYTVIDRCYVPDELQQSAEFRSLCPASAICMTKAPGSAHV